MPADEKLLRLFKKTLNPFAEKNFSDDALHSTSTQSMENEMKKKLKIPDPRIPKSLQSLYYAGNEFKEEEKIKIDKLVAELR